MRKRTIATTVIAATATVLSVLGVRKGVEYAAAPTAEKPCDYVPMEFFGRSIPSHISLRGAEPAPAFVRLGGTINDASCLNRTAVFGTATITSVEEVASALRFARENDLKITSAGQRHSMGGQSFAHGGLVLDMRGLDAMSLDKENRIVRVQSGATWAAVQEMLDKEGLSVKAMQSINIFTVGGTLSVNAHGVAHDPGQVAPTVRSLQMMLADGSIVTASPTENATLFRHVLGGYGLFGVILEAELDVVPNEVYAWSKAHMDHTEFPAFFASHVDGNPDLGLMYGRLSVSPSGYLRETAVHTFARTSSSEPVPVLTPSTLSWINRLVINLSKTGGFGRWLRWTLEKHVEPRIHACVSRNNAMSDDVVCDVARNQQMYDSMAYLKNRLPNTDILQEYFVPHEKMGAFVDGMRDIVQKNDANLLNVTIRIVHKDAVTALPYAKDDRFAFVLYFNQKFTDESTATLRKTTTDLIDLATGLGGTFYLPYQLYYTDGQLRAAYPEIDDFFAEKKRIDPGELFVNEWYLRYGAGL